jgi:hypothetical protein
VQEPADTITFAEVAPTRATAVTTIDGTPLAWRDTAEGLVVDAPGTYSDADPTVLALRHVNARRVP